MRLLTGVSLGCLGLAMTTPTCGGTDFGLAGGSPDASVDGGVSSSGGSGSNAGSGGGNSSSSGSGSGSSGGGSGGSSGSGSSGGRSSSGSGSSSSSGGNGSSSGSSSGSGSGSGGVDAGNDAGGDGGICDCHVDAACCTATQLCCSVGPVGVSYRCLTPTTMPPRCPIIVSDRNLKRDIEPVDEKAILDKVANMSVSTWSYKTDDPSVRHLGPMAQDFYSAFGLGDTDRGYYSVDAHGVALAAIKALAEQQQIQNARIEALERENRDLRERATCGP